MRHLGLVLGLFMGILMTTLLVMLSQLNLYWDAPKISMIIIMTTCAYGEMAIAIYFWVQENNSRKRLKQTIKKSNKYWDTFKLY